MKNKVKLIIPFLILLMTGCNVAYIPNQHNVPVMQEKGDTKINLSTTNIQGSYAFSDKYAVMANFYFRENDWESSVDSMTTTTQENYTANRFLGEAGIGYYNPLSEKATFEVFTGVGLGSIDFTNSFSTLGNESSYYADMAKVFLQPDIGYESEYFDAIFSTRLNYVGFTNIDTSDYALSNLKRDNLYNLNKHPYFFLEPAITLRLGYRYVKLHTQAILATKLNPEEINYRSFGINMGVIVDLSEIIYDN